MVGCREIPRESLVGWIFGHSTQGLSLREWAVRKTENPLSALFLVVISPVATGELLWITSQLDSRSTSRLKRFLHAQDQPMSELFLDREEDSSAFAGVLDRMRGGHALEVEGLREFLRRLQPCHGTQHDPSRW